MITTEKFTVNPGPTTEHDWAIHSVNIHGIFFERWCQKVIGDSPQWKIKSTNYPVEFLPPNGPIRGKESYLDIRAELADNPSRLSLLLDEFAAGQLLDWDGRGEGILTFGKHVPSGGDNADLENHGSHVQFVSGHHFFI